ncbi:hypothetical protein RRG08_046967 [Elysia crispata]|uniref:Uncharacterized protein n=1 Tax=Elysia crispata TaxID=231223 RepID=A0AAE1A8B6_9GAST|nr:hypothetical protein RRG08_046967 [Elysia crispata]
MLTIFFQAILEVSWLANIGSCCRYCKTSSSLEQWRSRSTNYNSNSLLRRWSVVSLSLAATNWAFQARFPVAVACHSVLPESQSKDVRRLRLFTTEPSNYCQSFHTPNYSALPWEQASLKASQVDLEFAALDSTNNPF